MSRYYNQMQHMDDTGEVPLPLVSRDPPKPWLNETNRDSTQRHLARLEMEFNSLQQRYDQELQQRHERERRERREEYERRDREEYERRQRSRERERERDYHDNYERRQRDRDEYDLHHRHRDYRDHSKIPATDAYRIYLESSYVPDMSRPDLKLSIPDAPQNWYLTGRGGYITLPCQRPNVDEIIYVQMVLVPYRGHDHSSRLLFRAHHRRNAQIKFTKNVTWTIRFPDRITLSIGNDYFKFKPILFVPSPMNIEEIPHINLLGINWEELYKMFTSSWSLETRNSVQNRSLVTTPVKSEN